MIYFKENKFKYAFFRDVRKSLLIPKCAKFCLPLLLLNIE